MKGIIFLTVFCLLSINSCNSQNKESQKKIGSGAFHLEKITFKENKDTLFSMVNPILESNKYSNIDIYFIESDEEITMLGNQLLDFSRMDWYINKDKKNIIALEIFSSKLTGKNYENVLTFLKNKFEKIDLTNQKIFSISKKILKAYTNTYLFKGNDKYILIDHTIFEKSKNDDTFRIRIYKYPFDESLIKENLIDKSILNK
ncbi:hypothetical protein INQ45_01875 [Flavobacterium columnare]|uniref:hypothetical protein n=1 Tax=Flavobacterium columnare TaxID=996 RepID=UPI002D2049EB|nr:hypothetical protein [Flavobacterium columnare]MEB3799873.1 hypothetical protein [Flavobacterium columnare]